MATVAKLAVSIGAEISGLEKSLKKATSSLESFGKRASAIGSSMSTFITAPIVGGLTLAVKAASDAEETFSKFATIFRDVESSAEGAFRTLTNEYNMSNKAAKELLGNTGDLLTGFGFTQDEALKLSLEVNKLAADLSSFNNFSGGAKGASDALTKALLGEREALKSLGITVQEENLKKQVALNISNGIIHSTELQAKAYATLQLATQQSGNAIGDVGRTMGSFANQLISVQNAISNLSDDIGRMLLPMAQTLLERVKTLVQQFQDLSHETKTSILNFTLLFAAIGPVVVVLGQAAIAMSVLGKALAFTIANPFTLVYAGAVALLGIITKVYLEYRKTKSLIEDMPLGADMALTEQLDVSITRLRDLQAQLDKLQEKQKNTASGNVVGTFDIQIMQLRKRIEQERSLVVQLVERSKAEKSASDESVKALAETNTEVNKVSESYTTLKETIEANQLRIDALLNSTVELTIAQQGELASLVGINTALEAQIELRRRVAEAQARGVQTGISQQDIPDPGKLKQGTVDSQRYAESMAILGGKVRQVTVDTTGLAQATAETSNVTETLNQIGQTFVDSFGAGMANLIVQGGKFKDILSNIGRLLASAAIQKGISILLTGGLTAGKGFFGGGGGIFGAIGKLFTGKGGTTTMGDGMITSAGRIVKFSPKDNILAMKDFGALRPQTTSTSNVRVSVDTIRLSGSDILIALKNAERAF